MPRVKGKPRRAIIQHSPEKYSWSDDETDGLRKGESEQNEVSLLETVQKSGSHQSSDSGKAGAEKNPIPGPSSQTNKVRNLKKSKEPKLQSASSSLTKMDLKKIRKPDRSGKCGDCHRVYAQILIHSKNKHNRKLKKCTTTGCKIYFASAQNRIEHEKTVHRVWKKYHCPHCNHSTDRKRTLNIHVLRQHSEKKIECRELNCGSMFAFEADLKLHVDKCHKMVICPKCCREMSLKAMYDHNRYGRCPGKVAE